MASGAAGQVHFELTAENAQLVQKVVEGLSALDKMGDKGAKAGEKASSGWGMLGGAMQGVGGQILALGTAYLGFQAIASRVMEGVAAEAKKAGEAFGEAQKRAAAGLGLGAGTGPGGFALSTLAREGLEGMTSGTTTRAQRVGIGGALVEGDEDLRRNVPKMLELARQADRASIGDKAVTGQSSADFARSQAQLAKVFEGDNAADVTDAVVRMQEEGIKNLDEGIRALQQFKQIPGVDMDQAMNLTVGALKQDQSGKLLASLVDKMTAEIKQEVDVAASLRSGRTVFRKGDAASSLAGLSPAERMKAFMENPSLMGGQGPELRAALAGAPKDFMGDVRREDVLGGKIMGLGKDPRVRLLREEAAQAAEMDRIKEDRDPERIADERAKRELEASSKRRFGDGFAGDAMAGIGKGAIDFAAFFMDAKAGSDEQTQVLMQIDASLKELVGKGSGATGGGRRGVNVNAHAE